MKPGSGRAVWMLAAFAASSGACHRAPSREEAVAALVQAVVLPSYADLSGRAAALTRTAETLATHPDPGALTAVQAAWRQTLIALERTYAFRSGPIVDHSLHVRAAYWPIRAAALEALAVAPALDQSNIQQAGAASKGLFALEYLLFEPDGQHLLTDPGRRRLLRLLARDFERSVNEVKAAADTGDLARALTARTPEAIARIANDLIETAETVGSGRLDHVLALRQKGRPSGGAGTFRGERSGSSLEATRALLEGINLHYLGGGDPKALSSVVASAAPAIDRSIREAMTGALAAVTGLGAPLEVVAASDPARVRAARQACRGLEIALKTGLVSALGIPLLFRSVDGD